MKRWWAAWLVAAWLVLTGARVAHAESMTLVDAASGPRVAFRVEPGLEASARKLAPRTERHLAEIEADLPGLPRLARIEVRLVKHTEDLSAAAPPGMGAPVWAAGVAYPEAGVVVIAARGASGQLLDLEQTLAHELAHMALEHALGKDRAPRWLHEGFAYLHSSDFSLGRANTLAGAAFSGKIIPIGALDSSFPRQHNEVSLAYAESYDFVAFLARRGRWQDDHDDGDRWAFRQFLSHVAAGESTDRAAFAAFGRSIDQLEGEWYESLRSRYLFYPLAALGGLFWCLLALLAFVAWWRKRREFRRLLAAMEAEEARAAALFRVGPAEADVP